MNIDTVEKLYSVFLIIMFIVALVLIFSQAGAVAFLIIIFMYQLFGPK